jgi:hypothetical protein
MQHSSRARPARARQGGGSRRRTLTLTVSRNKAGEGQNLTKHSLRAKAALPSDLFIEFLKRYTGRSLLPRDGVTITQGFIVDSKSK